MKFKSLVATAVIAACGVSNSFAGGGGLGVIISNASFSSTVTGSFTDTWTFSLDGPSTVAASLTNVEITFGAFTYNGINNFSAWLNGVPLFSASSTSGSTTVSVLAGGSSLPAGGFNLTVSGTALVGGASYGGNIAVAPVPEPESYVMLLAGLGAIAVIARRRSGKASLA